MEKKLISFILACALVFSLIGCVGTEKQSSTKEEFDLFADAIDLEFSKEIIKNLSSFTDDPATGNRSAASPAELEAANYLADMMAEIGLQNITKDAVTVDGWTYNGANLTYQNTQGQDEKIDLGGYATHLITENEELELVYLGKGTAADYEGVDVEGKLVLIDINQGEDWWINYPTFQAHVKGAKAVIAMTQMESEFEDRIAVQDICGPADAPAFAISQRDSLALQEMISASDNNEITVNFNSNSVITKDATTYNVWGEIPGETEEVIYIIGHYDGYFRAVYDNASGVATGISIAKALIDSDYTPNKTIRLVFHGAEEFGRSGTEYDWAAGSYEQIMTAHPEWAENGFALINIDGSSPLADETSFATATSHELLDFVMESAKAVNDSFPYINEFKAPAGTGTEDFIWTSMGIPSIVASGSSNSVYYADHYHSSMDSLEYGGFNDDAFLRTHQLYGKFLLDLDNQPVRPMSFDTRFTYFIDSIDSEIIQDEELLTLLEDAKTLALSLNDTFATVSESGTQEEVAALNKEIYQLYKKIQDEFLRIDFGGSVVFPHELYQSNIKNLSSGIESLTVGDVATAYDTYLSGVDFAWYAMFFDEEVTQYFANQLFANSAGTWGEGRIEYPICDIGNTIRSLKEKYDVVSPDLSVEIDTLHTALTTQESYLLEVVANEKKSLNEIISMMKLMK